MNVRGVILGGVVAGVVINISEYVLNEIVLAGELAAVLAARNLPSIGAHAILAFVVLGFVLGVALVWCYASIRARFGPGPTTAAIAGVVVWFLAYFWSTSFYVVVGLIPLRVFIVSLVWGLAELVVAALVGGRLYTET